MKEKKIKKMLRYARVSLAVEGLYLTTDEEELLHAVWSGEISREEYKKLALELSLRAREGSSLPQVRPSF
jgi:hypothetical protein